MKNLLRKQIKILEEISRTRDVLKGSISSVCSTCHRARCICKNKNEKIIYRLTYKDKSQTTKTVYVHKYNLKKVKSMIKNFEKIKKAIDELVEINIKLLRADQKLTSEKNK